MRAEKLPGRNWGESSRRTEEKIGNPSPPTKSSSRRRCGGGGGAERHSLWTVRVSKLCTELACAALQNFSRRSLFQGKQLQKGVDVTQPCSEGWPGMGLTPHSLLTRRCVASALPAHQSCWDAAQPHGPTQSPAKMVCLGLGSGLLERSTLNPSVELDTWSPVAPSTPGNVPISLKHH